MAHVLVVDDEDDIRALVAMRVRRVIVTAFSDSETRTRAVAAGATGFLTKPFTLSDLDQHIAASLSATTPAVPHARPATA